MLGASLLLTALVAAVAANAASDREQARFVNAVQAADDRVRGRLDVYIALLRGAAGMFAANENVTADQFRAFAGRIGVDTMFPALQGIGYARRLPGSAADSGLDRVVITYLEPRDVRNRTVLGFDMFSEPVRRNAMERARDTGAPVVSGRVTLRQEIDSRKQAGFLVYVPVYSGATVPATLEERRARLSGFVYSPFRAGDLFTGIFGTEERPRLALAVHETPVTPQSLLFDSREAGGPRPAHRARHMRDTLDVAGHTWTMDYTALPTLDGGTWSRTTPMAVIVAGLLLSLAVFGLTRAQAEARSAAERNESVRSRFFATMSHELRTPINAIIGYTSLMLERVYGPLTEPQAQGLGRTQRAARHLLELVNDVLDISKLEAGKVTVTMEPVNLLELIEDLLATVRPMAEAQKSSLEVDGRACPPTMNTDPRRVRQIMLNLLSNAAKFGEGKPISVHCRLLGPGDIAIEVRDRGTGIAPDDLPRVFEEFVQLPNATAGGTGLGLPISRRLAELLGGRLEAESTPGEGSTFRLVLPLRSEGLGNRE